MKSIEEINYEKYLQYQYPMVLYNQKLFLEAFENKGKNNSYSGIKFWYVLKFQNNFFSWKIKQEV